MRTFDLAPLYRSTVGFDRLFSMLDGAGFDSAAPTYPPYNIERTGENAYRISIAVAGFADTDLTIEAKENTLTVRGEKQEKAGEKPGEVLYQGIAARAFERRFQLADYVQVSGAQLAERSPARRPRARDPRGEKAAPDSDRQRQGERAGARSQGAPDGRSHRIAREWSAPVSGALLFHSSGATGVSAGSAGFAGAAPAALPACFAAAAPPARSIRRTPARARSRDACAAPAGAAARRRPISPRGAARPRSAAAARLAAACGAREPITEPGGARSKSPSHISRIGPAMRIARIGAVGRTRRARGLDGDHLRAPRIDGDAQHAAVVVHRALDIERAAARRMPDRIEAHRLHDLGNVVRRHRTDRRRRSRRILRETPARRRSTLQQAQVRRASSHLSDPRHASPGRNLGDESGGAWARLGRRSPNHARIVARNLSTSSCVVWNEVTNRISVRSAATERPFGRLCDFHG